MQFANNQQIDWWQNVYELAKAQKSIIDNQFQYVSFEMQFPVWLRGKSSEEKQKYVGNNIYALIDKMLINMKDNLVTSNRWVETINPRKVSGMIIGAHNLNENIALMYNADELSKNVTEACNVLYEETIKVTEKPENIPVHIEKNQDTSEKKEINVVKKNNNESTNSTMNSDDQKKFSYEERVDHKQALIKAQEKFFEMCVLSDANVESFKENIAPIKKWSGIVNTIHLSNDEIKIEKYSFSKKHFLKNSWFRNRLMEKYCNLFGFNNVELILPKTNSNVLIIEGSME
jgi:hypothetical protein